MPTPCYISITGQTQGNITAGAFTADSVGNIYVQGHEDEMLVQEFLHNVTVPTDPQSGQPAGQRAHKPFIFTVALNKAVPLMYNALASGEMLPTTELHWWRTSVEGKQEHYFTTRLTDSTIVDMKLHMPHCQERIMQSVGSVVIGSGTMIRLECGKSALELHAGGVINLKGSDVCCPKG